MATLPRNINVQRASNPFAIQPADFSLGVQNVVQGAIQGAEAGKKLTEEEEDKAAMTEFSENLGNWTPQEIVQFGSEHPRIFEQVKASTELNSKLTKEENLNQAVKSYKAFMGWGEPAAQGVQPPQQQPVPDSQMMTGLDGNPVAINPATGQPEQAGSPFQGVIEALSETAAMEHDAGNPKTTGHMKAIQGLMAGDKEAATRVKNGLLATIAALDPAQAKFLAGLDPDAATEASNTDMGKYVEDEMMIDRGNQLNATPEDVEEGRKAKLRQTALEKIKRAQAQEAGDVSRAKEDAKWDVISKMAAGVERDKAVAVYQGKQEETRSQNIINDGISAAMSVPNIRRGILLLEEIETGGWSAVALKAKNMMGIESGNEGELSNRLGKAVIKQYRETFGAAFTKEEGDKLDRIEASIGKSPASNKRILSQLLIMAQGKTANAIKAAEKRGDTSAVEEINGWMAFDLAPEGGQALPEGLTEEDITFNKTKYGKSRAESIAQFNKSQGVK